MQLDETSRALRSRLEDSARGTSLNEVASLVVPLTTAGRFSDAIDYAERAFREWDRLEPGLRNDMAVHYALALHVTGNRRKLTRFMAGPARSLSVEAQARIQIKSAWSELMGGDDRKSGVTASSARQICDPEDSQLVLAELMYLEGYRSFSRAGDLHAGRGEDRSGLWSVPPPLRATATRPRTSSSGRDPLGTWECRIRGVTRDQLLAACGIVGQLSDRDGGPPSAQHLLLSSG